MLCYNTTRSEAGLEAELCKVKVDFYTQRALEEETVRARKCQLRKRTRT